MALIGNRATATFCAAGLALATCATAQIRVVTTIPDFANIVQRIGGDAVTTTSLTKGHEDLHLVRIRPSLLIKLRRAGAFVQLGLDGEHAWVPAMMRTARNRQVQPGRPGFCDASLGIAPLQVPAKASRGAGPDLHPRGNPHYNVDPIRMRTAARNIRDCLIRIDPTNKRRFAERCAAWEKELDVRLKAWHKKLAPFRGAEFIEAHSSWIYFAQTFGLNVVARLEPSPGMSPTPGHLAKVMRIGKQRKIGFIVGRPRLADVARRVAKEIGAKSIMLQTCSSTSGTHKGWFAYMDHVVDTFAANLRKPETPPAKGTVEKTSAGK